MTSADPLAWYPGHCYIETVLYRKDHAQGSSKLHRLNHTVHKRNLPTDVESEKVKLHQTELHTNTEHIPEGSFQLTRFVGLARNAPELAETLQDRRTLASTFSALGFPLDHAKFALESPRVEHGRLYVGDETDVDIQSPAFYATGSRLCLMWRFEAKTKSTRALIVNYTPSSTDLVLGFMPGLEAIIQHFSQCFGHPMFIGIPFVQFFRADSISLYDQDSDILNAIENEVSLKSTSRIGAMQQLRDLGRLIGHDKFVLSALRSFLDQARLFNQRAYADNEGHLRDPVSKHFLAHLEAQQDLLALDVMFLENMKENVVHQQSAIGTIVNMQDSTSMKTIAFITMVFLPGTFLASVFAMPVFPSGRDDTFWLYWVICLPLTALVFLVWLAWFGWHTIRPNYNDPQKTNPPDSKAWLKGFYGHRSTQAENHVSHRHILKRLAGDEHKEWLGGFRTATTERLSDSPVKAVHEAQTNSNVQSV